MEEEVKGRSWGQWGERGFSFVCRMTCGIKEIGKVGYE